MAIFVNYI